MDLSNMSRRQTEDYGKSAVAQYLKRRGFRIIDRNATGEIDLIARKEKTLHFFDVKTIFCTEFPEQNYALDSYDQSADLHAEKIQKVAMASEEYLAEKFWKGAAQVDGVLVWLRARDWAAKVVHLPQIL
ncbi:MAG: putative endonuclease [Parcubacteria bacterium C7867-004]|nr:MAG: putative endonuclease [Parcubacteria bacterium C7867-004]